MTISILAPYETFPAVGPKLATLVRKLCGPRYVDILLHLPFSGTDRRQVCTIAEATAGQVCTIKVNVLKHNPTPPRVRKPWKIDVADETGLMQLIFFSGGKWLEKKFPVGQEVIITGTVEGFLTEKQMLHPEAFAGTVALEEIARIWPNYHLTAGVTQLTMARAVAATLAILRQDPMLAVDWLPPQNLAAHNWPSFSEALESLHRPTHPDAFEPAFPARQRLVFDELLAWQLALLKVRAETQQQPGIAHPPALQMRQDFLHALPFELTHDQQHVMHEIDTDMLQPIPMLRLLQGDVGAGKTVVAFAAVLRAVAGGYQAAMMAPTEILATQHYENARAQLEPLGVRCALLTGKLTAAEKKKLHTAITAGEIQVVFGTHALIQKNVAFKNLSLAVIDEQHRFGVRQRLALMAKSGLPDGHVPDVLVMTATPIPRTLALTAYGDMDISILAEKPPGRRPINTTVMGQEKLAEMAQAVSRLLAKGEQVYWICPLVEESEKSDLAAATQRFEELQGMYGPQTALLHGRMKAAEKDAIMADFKAGKTKLLVSTTVIEVGVDVPQATTMIIEHAERFGLSQLHQLRGRVGRGSMQSHCILLYAGKLSNYAAQRLQIMRETEDGFLIAEKDLELRGPGESLGTAQSGHLVTRIANLKEDRDMVPLARELAQQLLASEPVPEQAARLDYLLKIFARDEAAQLLKSG